MNVQGNKGEIVIYQTEDGQTSLEVSLVEDTVWLSLNYMVALFDRDKSVISRHIKNIFREGKLDKRSVVAKYATTASDGKTYQVEYFNLDVIISVGYRVKSQRGTQFRIWASIITIPRQESLNQAGTKRSHCGCSILTTTAGVFSLNRCFFPCPAKRTAGHALQRT